MWRLLTEGSTGVLSVKSSWDLAGCADGLLTLGAGSGPRPNRSRPPPALCRPGPRPVQRPQPADWRRPPAWVPWRPPCERTACGPPHWVRAPRLAMPDADVTAPLSAGLAGTQGAPVVAGGRRRRSTPRRPPPGPRRSRPSTASWRRWSTRCRPDDRPAGRQQRSPVDPGQRRPAGDRSPARGHRARPGLPAGWLTSPSTEAPAVRRADRHRADGAPPRGRARAVVGGRPSVALRRRTGQRDHPGGPVARPRREGRAGRALATRLHVGGVRAGLAGLGAGPAGRGPPAWLARQPGRRVRLLSGRFPALRVVADPARAVVALGHPAAPVLLLGVSGVGAVVAFVAARRVPARRRPRRHGSQRRGCSWPTC